MSHPAFDLSGKIAIITGGAGLLGEQHARAIAAARGIPVLVDIAAVRVMEKGNRLSDELRWTVPSFAADITKPNEVKRVLAEVLQRYGRVDILINNAANNPKVEGSEPASFSRFESFSLDQWNADLAVGLSGAFICCQVFGMEMVRRGAGVIVNVSSDLGSSLPTSASIVCPTCRRISARKAGQLLDCEIGADWPDSLFSGLLGRAWNPRQRHMPRRC